MQFPLQDLAKAVGISSWMMLVVLGLNSSCLIVPTGELDHTTVSMLKMLVYDV